VHGFKLHGSRMLRVLCMSRTDVVTSNRREVLHRRVRWIVAFTIAYNVIEAVLAITAGAIASSAALIGFGLDSIIEVLSAAAVAWQFTRKDPERWEKVTVRVIAIAFFALAAYVTVDSVLSLTGVQDVDHSPLGITIAALSLLIMPALAWFERRTGKELRSASVVADSRQLLLCTYLSGSVLVGLLLNTLFGWAWADAVAALVIAVFAVREGIEAWKGDVESPFLLLSEDDEEVTINA
jgi:divalent metal cation (Fe/Co/Zn/Cd) transporter